MHIFFSGSSELKLLVSCLVSTYLAPFHDADLVVAFFFFLFNEVGGKGRRGRPLRRVL